MDIKFPKKVVKKTSLAVLLFFSWHSAYSCDVSQNSSGNTVFEDCFDREDQYNIKMPNLRVKSVYAFIAPGSLTEIEMGFEIENSGQRDTDEPFVFQGDALEVSNPGFDVKTTVYAVSEDHSTNIHFDTETSQWMPYSQTTRRVNKLAANSV